MRPCLLRFAVPLVLGGCLSACAVVGPTALQATRVRYNETVKQTTQEEMLLNVVRLRYADMPTSLAVSSIAAQFELSGSLGASPFFIPSSTDNAPFTSVLPQAGVGGADRPTFSLTPMDDAEYVRRLFTPLTLDGAVYLARTTWPIATVFRLYLENLNWVSNAQTASGPTPAEAPDHSAFLEGLTALQVLQQRGQVVFGQEERVLTVGEFQGAPSAEVVLQAAQQGLEVRGPGERSPGVVLRKAPHFVLWVEPRAWDSPEAATFARAFRLKPGQDRYDLTTGSLAPYAPAPDGLTQLELETRSLIQALFFVAHGVEVPADHLARNLARTTTHRGGQPFDWRAWLGGLFTVKSSRGGCGAREREYVGVAYRDHCFFIDPTDHDTKATFTLLLELAHLESGPQTGHAPVLTLPLAR